MRMWKALVVVGVVGVLGMAACGEGGPLGDNGPVGPPIQLPDPGTLARNDSGTVAAQQEVIRELILRNPCDARTTVPVRMIERLTGGPTWENEVHDCQRLVRGDDTFGPLVGIFPLDAAMGLTGQPDGVFVFASLFNWGVGPDQSEETYAPLGLKERWNCLWMKRQAGQWTAAVAPVADTGCVEGTNPPTSFPLRVTAARHREGNRYPPTGRWRWDEDSRTHYLDVKCGSAWCSVFPDGVNLQVPPVLTGPAHRVIPGFFDEQHLAVPTRDGLRPGPWVRIYPSDRLADADVGELNRGLVVASIEMADDRTDAAGVKYYRRRFYLQPVGDAYHADVWLSMMWKRGEYRRPGAPSGRAASRYTFQPQEAHSPVGAVRWRWSETDEVPWISCRQGCCTLEGAM